MADPDRRLRDALNTERSGKPKEDIEVPIGRGRVKISPTFSPKDVTEVEGGVEYPVGRSGSVGAHGYYRQYYGDPKSDFGVGVQGRIRFAKGGKVLNTKSWRK